MPNLPSENSFLILGNSVSGTSLLHGLLNNHPDCFVHFEWFRYKKKPEKQISEWINDCAKHAGIKVWGNKIPIEQFITSSVKWEEEQIERLIDYFKIVFIQRRYSMYAKGNAANQNYRHWWEFANHNMYWRFREKNPRRIIAVSFEDLCLRPKAELFRICRFLHLRFEYNEMYKGTVNLKSRKKSHGFDLERI